MRRHIIMPAAKEDIREISTWLSQNYGSESARSFRQSFHAKVKLLTRTPGIGQRRDDIAANVRITLLDAYAVIYHVTDNQLAILQIVHQSRDLTAVLRPFNN